MAVLTFCALVLVYGLLGLLASTVIVSGVYFITSRIKAKPWVEEKRVNRDS